jgi:hypothetical protein
MCLFDVNSLKIIIIIIIIIYLFILICHIVTLDMSSTS